MYRVFTNEFATFDEVVQYAWNEYKICEMEDPPETDADKQKACKQLELMIEAFEKGEF